MDCLNNEQALNSQLTSNSDSISNTLNSGDVVSSTLDTTDKITSTLSSNDNTTSQMGNEEPLNSVLDQPTIHKYVGGSTDNIIVEVDNVGKIITATLKPIRFKTAADFPVVGSDRLIYIDASNNSLYSWDSATQTYSQLVAGGGGGESYDDTELRNLITGLEESKASKTEVAETLSSAKGYTDTKVAELIDSAPETLDTFKEIADAFKENDEVLDALNSAIGKKVDKEEGKGLSTNDYTTEEKEKLAGLYNYDDTTIRLFSAQNAENIEILNKSVSNLNTNKADKSTTYTKEEVDSLIQEGDGVIVDEALSDTSINPVQNKTVTKALNGCLKFPNLVSGGEGNLLVGLDPNNKQVFVSLDSLTSNLPVGSIFSSAIPQTDARVHLLDGSTISQSGIYAEFATLLKSLVSSGYTISCTQAQFESDVSTYGQCGKFVIDNNAGTIRLPKITKFVEGLTSLTNIGQSFSAGLPNITGTFKSDGIRTASAPTSGAFTNTQGSERFGAYNPGVDLCENYWSFDASKSNPIYGNSTTVQPQATAYPYYIVLAGGYKSAEQVNIDKIVNDLNTKLSSETMEFVAGFDFPNSGNAFTIPLYKLVTEKDLLTKYNYTIKFVSCGQIPDNTVINVRVGNSNQELDYNGCFMKFGTEIHTWDSGTKSTMAYQGVDTYEFIYNYARAGEIVGEFNISTANDGTDAIVLLQGNYGRAIQGASYVVNAVRFVKYYNLSSINTLYVSSANAFGGFKGRVSIYRSIR